MKLLLIIPFLMIGLLPAFAQTDELSTIPIKGDAILPDSPFYGLETAIDRLILAIQSSDTKRAEIGLKIAEERLEEIEIMIAENKLEHAQRAEIEHEKIIDETRTAITKIKAETATDELRQKIEIESRIKNHDDNLDKLKIKIETKGELTTEQKRLIDSILDQVDANTKEIEIEIENEKGETKIKVKIETGLSDREIDDLEDEFEDDEKEEIETEEREHDRVREIKHEERKRSESDNSGSSSNSGSGSSNSGSGSSNSGSSDD